MIRILLYDVFFSTPFRLKNNNPSLPNNIEHDVLKIYKRMGVEFYHYRVW